MKNLNLLGLAKASGNIVTGSKIFDDFGKIKYLFIANDASEKSKQRLINKCYYYKTPYTLKYSNQELNKAIGSTNYMSIGIINNDFASKFKKMDEGGHDGK